MSGLVVSASGTAATIEVTSPVACRRCAAGRGCGAGLVGAAQSRTIEVRIPDGGSFVRGDSVRLVVDSRELLRAALFAYGNPLAGLLSFAALAGLAAPDAGDGIVAVSGLAGLLAGALVSRWRLGRHAECRRFVPVVDRPTG